MRLNGHTLLSGQCFKLALQIGKRSLGGHQPCGRRRTKAGQATVVFLPVQDASLPRYPLGGQRLPDVPVGNKVRQVINPVGSDGVHITNAQLIRTIRPNRCDQLVTLLLNAKRLNQVVKVQIDGQRGPLFVRIVDIDGLLVGVEYKYTPIFFRGMVVHKRKQVVIVLVECSILANQRRGDVPDTPPDSHLQNPAKHGIGWGAGIPEVECAFFQKQLLTLQGLLIGISLDVLDLHDAVGFGLRVHRLVHTVTLGVDLFVPCHIVIEWVRFAVDNRRNIERDFAGFGELDV